MARTPLPSSPWPWAVAMIALLQALAVPPGYAQNLCCGDTNYTADSQYARDLGRLLANLSTVPTAASRGHFHTASTTTDGSSPVYGLVQCRGDVLPADCAACLNLSASQVVARCTLRRAAVIRYDDCLLRYSNRSFLGTAENVIQVMIWNPTNRSDPEVFDRRLMELVGEITAEAAGASSRFAVGVKNYSELGDIYGMAQCTMDLPGRSCEQCLWGLFGSLNREKIGARVLALSCILRFEVTPFFSLSAVPPPPSPPPPLQPPPSPPPESPDNPPPPAKRTGGSPTGTGKKNNGSKVLIIAIISVVAAIMVVFAMVICLRRRPMKRIQNGVDEQHTGSAESLLFDIGTLRTATGNFSDANKLGEGGFGPVYKGVLPDGQQIAVKRLSRSSVQGIIELRNEVVMVAKLQHRNLVRLLGFCLQEEEKMVVYEYLPNTSLDKFLFDPIKRLNLDWGRRFKLIEGIARGLIYLHEDSRLRIVHRDLKASNILLDVHMNPKISDFGLAKLFGVEQSHGSTSRIAGTLGYMAPEYVMHGQFSTKSDVFSFGVLALEIVTGRRNSGFNESVDATDLLSYVWNLWNGGAAIQLLDRSVGERYQRYEVLRCVHIGLLCVQEDPSERPNMSSVALMLSSFSVTLPAPSRPAFFIGGSVTSNSYVHLRERNSALSNGGNSQQRMFQPVLESANEASISDLEPR